MAGALQYPGTSALYHVVFKKKSNSQTLKSNSQTLKE